MSRKKSDIIIENVTVESVAAEGKALAHVYLPSDIENTSIPDSMNNDSSKGRIVFMEFAVPGDLVDLRITKRRKSYLEARVLRIVKPSPSRLEPFCEHFGICGGCRWQPLPYADQLEAKRKQVQDQLVRIGHLEIPQVRPTLGSARTEEYRNKLEFSASNKKWIIDPADLENQNSPALGFHVGKFFDKVLDINRCHLQPEPSNEIRNFIRELCLESGVPFHDVRNRCGVLRNIMVRNNSAGDFMLVISFGEKFEGIEAFLDAICDKFPEIKSLYYVINTKCNDTIADLDLVLHRGDDAIYESMEGLRFKIGPKSFYQTNTGQALELYKVAREFAELAGDETVYDLYTGTGTIAQFVSSKARKVIGIEYVPEAIADARSNAAANGIENCEFFAGDMKDVLKDDFIAAHGHPDVVILDPPRAGIHPDVAQVILRAAPERIVYVSCNPATQARDLALFCNGMPEKDGEAASLPRYSIKAVQPVDMFPHTLHVENVVALQKCK